MERISAPISPPPPITRARADEADDEEEVGLGAGPSPGRLENSVVIQPRNLGPKSPA
jgi:hypothetical protein